jgi:electron transport complex protein RnfG
VDQLPDGSSAVGVEAVYLGYDADGSPIGYAIAAGEPGFQDIIGIIFGYDHRNGQVLGMKVLESKETPGLGDKIEKDANFVGQFDGALTPLLGVKARNASDDPHEIDMITGATISSRTIIRTINNAIERMGPMLDAYEENTGP